MKIENTLLELIYLVKLICMGKINFYGKIFVAECCKKSIISAERIELDLGAGGNHEL